MSEHHQFPQGLRATTAYLGLGSNLGDRRQNLIHSLKIMEQQLRLVRYSSVYDTAPQDNQNQPRFLNIVAQIITTLSPEHLLKLAKEIEAGLGRKSAPPNSPRPIDIDILFYDNIVRESQDPIIPHPRIAKRSFVLIPLAEIAPHFKHPITNKTAAEMLEELRLEEQEIINKGEINV